MPHKHETISLSIRQLAEQHSINDAKDSGVCANAQRESEYRDEAKAGMLHQHPCTVPQVLNHRVLPSISLHPERIPDRARAPLEQIELGAPVEPIPLG